MLEKGRIKKTIHCQDQFVNHLFLVPKRDGGQRSVINLKELNTGVPDKKFKMKGLHLLKEILKQGDSLCKLDLKDAYFCIASNKQSRKNVLFVWEVSLYKFLCLCFGVSSAPRLFTELIKCQSWR